MKRYYIAAAVMSVLAVSYQAYARWFHAITALEEPLQLTSAPETEHRPEQPPDVADLAEELLPDLAWAPKAKYSFERRDNVYIYTDSVQLIDEEGEEAGNHVEFAPFAMIVSDPDETEEGSYVIRCESARIRFENPLRLEFGAPEPGRLISGTLDGAVAITGPDGLEIYGQDFVFSEEAAHLYSYYPVSFAFGTGEPGSSRQSGSARQLEINLISSHNGVLGRDGPRIGGIASVILRHNVRLNLTYEQDGVSSSATISSQGVFEYDVESRIATFEEDVIVRRPTNEPGQHPQADELHCDWLALQFESTPPETNPQLIAVESAGEDAAPVRPVSGSTAVDRRREHPFANLRFRQLRAQGDRAVLRSDENRLLAAMRELRYDAVDRRILLLDEESVRLQYDTAELMSPDVEVLHDAEGEVTSIDCSGAGQLEQYSTEGGAPLIRVFWDQHLGYGFDPDSGLWLIQVDGAARVVQPGEMGIQADQVALWLDPEDVRDLSSTDDATDHDDTHALPLKYAQATGSVLMASPDFRIEADRLQATITQSTSPPGPDGTGGSMRLPGSEADAQTGDGTDSQDTWTLNASAVQVQVLHDPRTDESRLAEATAAGNVLITSDPADGSVEDAISIAGEQLYLDNRSGTGELLTLAGAPAHIRREDLLLEARNIEFDRAENTARVTGRGMLRFPVASDLNGKNLEAPVPLDVHWQEQMTFDGREAQFFGNVVLKLNDGRVNESRLYCEDLNVLLNTEVSFTGEQPETSSLVQQDAEDSVQFKRVTCRDGVRTELYEWDGTRLSGIRVFELAEFTLEPDTGTLDGLGPGVIRSWARGAGRRISIAPDASAEANQPAESAHEEWEYTQVHFARNMTGNARQRSVELHGRVRAIYAPVQHPREVFTRDELSGDSPNAENSVWLGCEQLAVSLHPWAMRENEDYAVFGASGHCELEGHQFRAVADLISFDQSKKLFTLKSLGSGDASIYYQRSPGESWTRVAGQLIEFNPSKQRVSLQGASAFQASP